MVNIDEYIEKSKLLSNTSDGGSPSYSFDDKVLVCYTIPVEYGLPRPNEESIMINVNKKNEKGVRTPAHLAMKRETNGNKNYCWVLQEKAKGESFSKYCNLDDPLEQLKRQQVIAHAPDSHFEKYVSDLAELFYFGLEPKPKNIFYDSDTLNGGFTTIDLLDDGAGKSFDSDSLCDINYLDKLCATIGNCSIFSYNKKATSEQKELSSNLYYVIMYKLFKAMSKVIPNFSTKERWLLREKDNNTLEKFKMLGLKYDDLTLTEEEEKIFLDEIDKLALDCVLMVEEGKSELWQIESNEVRIGLGSRTLGSAYMYSSLNRRNRSDKPDYYDEDEEYTDYDYESECKKDLEKICLNRFYKNLKQKAENSNNSHILEAVQEIDSRNKSTTIKV